MDFDRRRGGDSQALDGRRSLPRYVDARSSWRASLEARPLFEAAIQLGARTVKLVSRAGRHGAMGHRWPGRWGWILNASSICPR